MLKIKVIINSSLEEVLDFKCCHLPGQNLEIHLTNAGPRPVSVPSRCTLETDSGPLEIPNLYPPGGLTIPPGETIAFYATLEERIFTECRSIHFTDESGDTHRQLLNRGD